MGYMFVVGACASCGKTFSFNATYVPSIRISGEKQPICKGCIDRVNVLRKENGLDPLVIHPEAYKPEEVQ